MFDVTPGATLHFNFGTHALGLGTDFMSGGDVLISGSATLNVNTPLTLSALDPLFTLAAGGILGGSDQLTVNNTLTLDGGTLAGPGSLLTAGTTNVGLGTITMNNAPWDNTGTITVSGGARISMISASTLTNLGSGIINLTGTDTFPIINAGGAGSTFNNAGTLNKSSTTTQTINIAAVNNTGTFNVQSDQLNLQTNGTHTGVFDVTPGATLHFNAGTHTLGVGSDFTSGGDVLISGSATLNVNTPIALSALDPLFTVAPGGTLGGTGSVTIDNALSLTGGTISGGGLLQTTGATNVMGIARTSGKTWDNTGTITISGTGRLDLATASTLNNLGAGIIDITSTNVNGIVNGGGAGSTFNNAGTLNKSAAVSQNINAGAATTNTGTINISAGTAVMSDFTTNLGTVNLTNGATLSIGSAFTNAAAGIFNGNGTLFLGGATFTNSGTLAAGSSPGTLNVSGNLLLTGSSIVNAEIGGTNQGVDYDWIDVTGTASVAGTLNATLFGGFTPTAGNQFTIVSAAGGLSGVFVPANLPTDLAISYNANNVVLDFMAAFACLVDICWDGGGADTLWTTALNWTGDVLPSAGNNVSIDLGGVFTVDFGTTIGLNTLTLGADDVLNINSGTLTLALASVFNGALNLAGGTWVGNSNDIVNGAFNWSGGSATGTGLLTTNGPVTINAPGGASLARDWTATAPVSWGVGNLQVTGVTLTNQSTFNANAGATLTLTAGSTFANAGTFNVNSNTLIDQGSFNNTNTVNVLTGELSLNTTYTQTAGTTVLGGSDITTVSPLAINGGTLQGAGTVTGDVALTAATLIVAGSTGTTTIDGNFSMTGASMLDIEVGGLTQGAATGGFDHLAVTGTANLAGTLNATVTGGFVPTNGNQFQFLTAGGGVTGVFATENLPTNFSLTYGGNNAFLGFFNCLVDICWDGGGGDTDWTNPLNWHLNALPLATSDVSIDLPGITSVDFNTVGTVNSLAIANDDILNLTGGLLSLTGTSTLQGAINLAGGDLTVNGQLNVPGTVNLATGTLTTVGTTTIPGTLNWSGAMASTLTGAGMFNASGAVAITQGGDKQIIGATPIFSGTTTWDGAGTLLITNGSTLTNQGNFTINGPANVDALTGVNAFVNAATLTKNGAGTAVVFGSMAALSFDNPGTVNVNGGILQVAGRNLGGTFNTAAGTAVNFLGGTNLLGDTSVLGGSGTYQFIPGSGGSMSFNGAGTGTTLGSNATFNLTGTTVGGTGILNSLGTVNLTNSTFGGTLINTGTTNLDTSNINGSLLNNGALNVLAGASQVNGAQTAINSGVVTVSAGATLTKNTGAFNWNGGTLGGTGDLFLLAGGATFNITGGGNRILDGLNLTVNNLTLPGGSFEVRSGSLTVTGATTVPAGSSFIHSGGIASLLGPVDTAGLFSANNTTLNLDSLTVSAGTFSVSNGADLTVATTSTILGGANFTVTNAMASTGALSSAGTVTAGTNANVTATSVSSSGMVNINGGGKLCSGSFTQTNGTTRVDGLLDVSSGGININGGNLFGNGTVMGDVTVGNAKVSAGASPGTLTIDGNLVLGSGSQITAELGGLTQGVDYDLIAVSGSAQLGGALDVLYTGGFSAIPESAFDLITYANATGSFSSIVGPLGVVFTASDFGTFFQFFIERPPAPADPLVPEFGVDPVLGTLPTSIEDPGDGGFFFSPAADPEVELPDGKTQTKCN